MAVVITSPPKQGQLVTVRQRHYVVTEVSKSSLPDKVLQLPGSATFSISFHFLSWKTKGWGAELQVI